MSPLFNRYNLSIETLLCCNRYHLSLIGIPASTFTTPASANIPKPGQTLSSGPIPMTRYHSTSNSIKDRPMSGSSFSRVARDTFFS